MSKDLAVRLLRILHNDRTRLQRIDDYLQGKHDDPYMPADADDEYKLLARRCVSNWLPLVAGTPAQALYVDGFRRGRAATSAKDREIGVKSVEWQHWQASRLDQRQAAIYRGALNFGHAFTLTETRKGEIVTYGLSALKTSALFEDPANDLIPTAALTVIDEPGKKKGKARLFVGPQEFEVAFRDYTDEKGVTLRKVRKHPVKECPVTRFATAVDLEGRTIGVVEPLIPLQDRINQSVFDLLIAQTYGSFKVRTVTGMAPPVKTKAVLDHEGQPTGEFEVDTDPTTGRPIPEKVHINASRLMFAENSESRFGTLDETPLDGYISSIDLSVRHLGAISQTPPHHLLGQIANLSAEALDAAEQALARKVEEIRKSFGESWERVFQIAAELAGETAAAEDDHGEVLWRDMAGGSLAMASDALLKFRDLGIPVKGLMRRVPGVTQGELASWEEMLEEEPQQQIASRLTDSRGRSAGTLARPLLRDESAVPA